MAVEAQPRKKKSRKAGMTTHSFLKVAKQLLTKLSASTIRFCLQRKLSKRDVSLGQALKLHPRQEQQTNTVASEDETRQL
jgi:hypothetical protein